MRKSGLIFPTLLEGVIRSKAALAGATMFVVLFPVLLVVALIDLAGGIENPYYSLLLYLVLSPLLLVALLLIASGLWRTRGKDSQRFYSYEFIKEYLLAPDRYQRLRRLLYAATGLAALFFFVLGVAAHSGYRYANSMEFCGTFCHQVMEPEYISHKKSPHSRVRCVVCHSGADSGGDKSPRLAGIRHFYTTLRGDYSRPIPAPTHSLRPSRKTCEECHRPEKFHGHKLYFRDTFLADEDNTHLQTAMIIKVGAGGAGGRSAQGIHWHISADHTLSYIAADPAAREIARVLLTDRDGNGTIYLKEGVEQPAVGYEKKMDDCTDCHNRPTHIFLPPEAAIDQQILAGRIPRTLPFSKRQALAAVTSGYATSAAARQGIAARLRQWYTDNYPELVAARPDLLARAIAGAQQAYAENVFPEMNSGWNVYPDFACHLDKAGCFRCHDGSFKSADGSKAIPRECNLCHIILAKYEPVEQVRRKIIENEWQ